MVMKNYRRSLPPLDCLVFFEAAARRLSFSRAGEELLVSQTAVSKRIRQLEQHLGRDLFLRDGRSLSLTAEGEQLRDQCAVLLDFAETSLASLSRRADAPVRIAANSAVSLFWLGNALRDFGLSEQSCPVELVTSDQTATLTDRENDLAILYGAGTWEGVQAEPLLGEVLLPVATPELAAQITAQLSQSQTLADCPADARPPLLTFKRMGPDWTNWESWPGLHDLTDWELHPCRTYAQSIGRAIAGEGLALGSFHVLEQELSSGALVPLSPALPHPRHRYFLTEPKGTPLTPGARDLRDFLLARRSL